MQLEGKGQLDPIQTSTALVSRSDGPPTDREATRTSHRDTRNARLELGGGGVMAPRPLAASIAVSFCRP
ncbi:hypothetical protein DV515_00012204 [Chloebia gouldiae]|uniref:Uncharacterized protein n=1 Tax=Chloebia gouldiae TaxID=44316 RepID=A0A3L8S5D1_CHLGU|nr:hypothetical protein DV515_00012204 [Chloebia gouldiae]